MPASKPIAAGIPMPTSRRRASTTARYRATGSLSASGTNTGRVR
ncbi:Uncharacterised protein [Mycobacterium tuberculosis]|uniref:Uncharacterized protein n=1 Tax=Mycobacterium tuberculosis TaxID=1773 RepID=A0A0U0QWV1_MYCTX|nr:Uncharacterised protein [Mycobacterium tuberculosis]